MTIARTVLALEIAIQECAMLLIAVDALATDIRFVVGWNAADPAQRRAVTESAMGRICRDMEAAGLHPPPESVVLPLIERAFTLAAPQPRPAPSSVSGGTDA